MNVEETLNRAADLIEERGWTQFEGWGDSLRGDEAVSNLCLEGAIAAASGVDLGLGMDGLWLCPAYQAVGRYLERDVAVETHTFRSGRVFAARGPRQELWRWNDANGRTASEVVEVLRAAAVVASARVESRVEVDA